MLLAWVLGLMLRLPLDAGDSTQDEIVDLVQLTRQCLFVAAAASGSAIVLFDTATGPFALEASVSANVASASEAFASVVSALGLVASASAAVALAIAAFVLRRKVAIGHVKGSLV